MNIVHYVKLAHIGSSTKLHLFIYLFIFTVHPVTHLTPDMSKATAHYIHFIKY